jgi:hypothetical protein
MASRGAGDAEEVAAYRPDGVTELLVRGLKRLPRVEVCHATFVSAQSATKARELSGQLHIGLVCRVVDRPAYVLAEDRDGITEDDDALLVRALRRGLSSRSQRERHPDRPD